MQQLEINAGVAPEHNPTLDARCIQAYREAGEVHAAADMLGLPWYVVQGILARCKTQQAPLRPDPLMSPSEAYFKALVPEAVHSAHKKNSGNTNFRVGKLNVQVTRVTRSGHAWTFYVGHQKRKPQVCVGIMFDEARTAVERIVVVPASQVTRASMSLSEGGGYWRFTMHEDELRTALSHLQP